MKNQSLPTVVWWRSRNRKREHAAKHFVEGYGMQTLVPACHVGTISAFEQAKIRTEMDTVFSNSTDRWFIAPICSACHRRFTSLNEMPFEDRSEFEIL